MQLLRDVKCTLFILVSWLLSLEELTSLRGKNGHFRINADCTVGEVEESLATARALAQMLFFQTKIDFLLTY